jgi:hypothetical protein
LDWYHSSTYALFPDETHATIKRTFHTPAAHPAFPPTRRQFCGYCGTHLTAWNEGVPGARDRSADFVDVTLGSLLNDSLKQLEDMKLYGDWDEESESGLVRSPDATIDEEEHIPTNETQPGGVDGSRADSTQPQTTGAVQNVSVHRMQGRGMPYFEEMVENSRLGRIKRQKGGHTSADGRTKVQWEILEIGGGAEDEDMADVQSGGVPAEGNGSKRIRLDA